MWQSIGLTLLVIVATLACVLLFMLCGECRGAGGRLLARLRRAVLVVAARPRTAAPGSQSVVVPLGSD